MLLAATFVQAQANPFQSNCRCRHVTRRLLVIMHKFTWKPSLASPPDSHLRWHQLQGGIPWNQQNHSYHCQRSWRHGHRTLQHCLLGNTLSRSSWRQQAWACHRDSPAWTPCTTHWWCPRHISCLTSKTRGPLYWACPPYSTCSPSHQLRLTAVISASTDFPGEGQPHWQQLHIYMLLVSACTYTDCVVLTREYHNPKYVPLMTLDVSGKPVLSKMDEFSENFRTAFEL